MEGLGKLFSRDVILYVFPVRTILLERLLQRHRCENMLIMNPDTEVISIENLILKKEVNHLYRHLVELGAIRSLKVERENLPTTFSPELVPMIQQQNPLWEEQVPAEVSKVIKESKLWQSLEGDK